VGRAAGDDAACDSRGGDGAILRAQYLTAASGEVPGVWSGRQRAGLGLSGQVEVDALESLLFGRDPTSGTPLGRELLDRYTTDGRVVRAVSGFDATFSAPKSLSEWWALTGDHRLLEAHDLAVTAALAHLERFGSTTRIRANGGRLHPDTNGLTIATFRQTTSRADDPQIHTHAVISAKVQTRDGRWLAFDARYLKRHQRMLGGLYQSVLRAELTHRSVSSGDRSSTGRPRSPASQMSCARCSRSAAPTSTRHSPTSSTTSANARAASRHGGSAPR
jgi:conjugative relaxase-like TrwC/TraI family protein